MSNIEIIAEGLQFPRGQSRSAGCSVILVEIKRQTLTRVWNGKSEVIAKIGGPNGAALGPDGAMYVTNNGGFAWHGRADDPWSRGCGSRERADRARRSGDRQGRARL